MNGRSVSPNDQEGLVNSPFLQAARDEATPLLACLAHMSLMYRSEKVKK